MKKVFLFIAALIVAQLNSFAQGVQASLKPGSVAAQTIVTLKNNSGAALGGNYLSSLSVSIRIPDQGANNPTLIVTGLNSTTPNVTLGSVALQGGYAYYVIGCTYGGNQPFPMAVAQEKDIIAFSFQGTSGTTAIISSVEMVDFIGGGPSLQNQFYFSIAGAPLNDQTNPFYATPQSTGLDNLGDPRKVGIGSVPLSVTWLDFTASKSGDNAILNWATATEKGNAGFDVERSADGKNFSKIGFVGTLATEGNSTEKLSYNFTDSKPFNGENHYRLKQTDRDGKTSYSKVSRVTFGGGATSVQVYPNPTNVDVVRVKGNNISSIAVYNIAGQQIQIPVTYGVSENVLNTSGLSSGNYTIRVSADGAVSNHKLVVQH